MKKQTEQSGSMLLIDGAYLFLGSRDLEKKTNRKLVVNNVSLQVLLNYMQQKAQVDFLPSLKHYVTAEMDTESTYKRQSLYTSLTKQGITVDIRSFKGKQAFCPGRDCAFSKKSGTQGFQIQVQQEVDVAIVMKVMDAGFDGKMDSLVLLAGDGDFKDMLQFVTDKLKKQVHVFGYSANTSQVLKDKASPGCFFALDEIWEHISEPKTPEKTTSFKVNPETETNFTTTQRAETGQWAFAKSQISPDDSTKLNCSSIDQNASTPTHFEIDKTKQLESNRRILGQLGFDQALIDQVLTVQATSENPQNLTSQAAVNLALAIKK